MSPMFLCGAGVPIITMVPGPAAARVAAEWRGIQFRTCSCPFGATTTLPGAQMPCRTSCAAE